MYLEICQQHVQRINRVTNILFIQIIREEHRTQLIRLTELVLINQSLWIRFTLFVAPAHGTDRKEEIYSNDILALSSKTFVSVSYRRIPCFKKVCKAPSTI